MPRTLCGRGFESRTRAVERECGVLPQDRRLELAELRARLEAEIIGERAASGLVRTQGVGLASGAVQAQHELCPKTLSVGVLGDECLKLGDERCIAAEREVGVDLLVENVEQQLLQPGDGLGGEGLGREVGERSVAPELERLAQQRRPALLVAGGLRLRA